MNSIYYGYARPLSMATWRSGRAAKAMSLMNMTFWHDASPLVRLRPGGRSTRVFPPTRRRAQTQQNVQTRRIFRFFWLPNFIPNWWPPCSRRRRSGVNGSTSSIRRASLACRMFVLALSVRSLTSKRERSQLERRAADSTDSPHMPAAVYALLRAGAALPAPGTTSEKIQRYPEFIYLKKVAGISELRAPQLANVPSPIRASRRRWPGVVETRGREALRCCVGHKYKSARVPGPV